MKKKYLKPEALVADGDLEIMLKVSTDTPADPDKEVLGRRSDWDNEESDKEEEW